MSDAREGSSVEIVSIATWASQQPFASILSPNCGAPATIRPAGRDAATSGHKRGKIMGRLVTGLG
jgi:hypothetical protein